MVHQLTGRAPMIRAIEFVTFLTLILALLGLCIIGGM